MLMAEGPDRVLKLTDLKNTDSSRSTVVCRRKASAGPRPVNPI